MSDLKPDSLEAFQRLISEQTSYIDEVDKQIDKWTQFQNDYHHLRTRLSTLPDRLTYECMVPFGKLAFIPGRIIHSNEILVLLGENYFVERSCKQSMDIINRRLKNINENLEKHQKEKEVFNQQKKYTNDFLDDKTKFFEIKEIDDNINIKQEKKTLNRRTKLTQEEIREERRQLQERAMKMNENKIKKKVHFDDDQMNVDSDDDDSQQMRKDNSTLQELGEYMHLLYLNDDKTLHDCSDMDNKNIYFTDIIKDYQSYRLTKRTLSTSSTSGSSDENLIFTTPILNLTSNITNILQTLETKLIHIDQSTEYTYIAIAIIKGKMLSITIHMSPSSLSTPNISENGHSMYIDTIDDNYYVTNLFSPILTSDKDIPLASLSTARCGFGIISTNNTIFVVGGYDRGDCLDTIEQFNPIDGKWTLLSVPMTSRRGRVSAAIINNKIYVYGGSNGQQELNTGEYFDLQSMDKWSPIKDLATPVAHGATCSDDSYIYLIGGCEGDKCKNDCYRYDPEKNQWSILNSMNHERSQAASVYFNGKIYVFGGYTSNRCLSSCEILTLSTNEWSIGPSMRENRRGCGAVLYENKIFIIGGSNGITSLTSIEIYDPIINEWIINTNGMPNELNIPRVGVGITICNEKLYVIGGFDGRNFLKSIEVYDKYNQRWKLSNNINNNNNKLEKINY
ncbi:unnamed protein product [Rotaria sp. Silwood1]|nr:unnamed protein product [Rotaria sp. Silwood1]